MSYQHPSIRWLSDGQTITGYYILDRIEFPINISGWPLLHGVLRDAGDSMEMICRKPSEDITDAWNGAIVAVSGTVRAQRESVPETRYSKRSYRMHRSTRPDMHLN